MGLGSQEPQFLDCLLHHFSQAILLSHEPQGDPGCQSDLEHRHSLANQETLLDLLGLLDLVVLEVLGKRSGTDSGCSFVAFHSEGSQVTGFSVHLNTPVE